MTSIYRTKSVTEIAEQIQGRFTFNDDDEVIACSTSYFSDILGSDWCAGSGLDMTNPKAVYRKVKEAATRKYGTLPF